MSGTEIAKQTAAQLSAFPSRVLKRTGGLEATMRNLLTILIAVMIAMVLSIATFAQKGRNDNRPPKNNPPIVERPKPPPNNGGNQNSNKRGKP